MHNLFAILACMFLGLFRIYLVSNPSVLDHGSVYSDAIWFSIQKCLKFLDTIDVVPFTYLTHAAI